MFEMASWILLCTRMKKISELVLVWKNCQTHCWTSLFPPSIILMPNSSRSLKIASDLPESLTSLSSSRTMPMALYWLRNSWLLILSCSLNFSISSLSRFGLFEFSEISMKLQRVLISSKILQNLLVGVCVARFSVAFLHELNQTSENLLFGYQFG